LISNLPNNMIFNTFKTLALLPFATILAAPLLPRQSTNSASGQLILPVNGTSVVRGNSGALEISYTPGPLTSYIDVELVYRTQDDDEDEEDDTSSYTVVENWAPNPNNSTAPLTAFFRLRDDDFDVNGNSGDDNDNVACDGQIRLRVTEHQINGNDDNSFRLPSVNLTLACPSSST